eukprot:gene12538-35486_t
MHHAPLHAALLAIPAAALTQFQLPFPSTPYTASKECTDSDNGEAVVHWRVDADHIYLGLAANAGWVAFGMAHTLQQGNAMVNADIVVC